MVSGRVRSGARRLAARLRRYAPQPLLGVVLAALAACALALSWLDFLKMPAALAPPSLWLAAVLGATIVTAKLHPVHVARGYKVSLQTVPLYLLAVLTTPSLAATAAGVAVLIGELAQRRVKGQYPSDIAATVGHWVVLVLVASLVARAAWPAPSSSALLRMIGLPADTLLSRLPLVLAALWLFAGDTLTVALEIGAITGDAPHRLVRTITREGGAAEGVQYVVGLLGTLAARQDAWSIVLLVLPALILRDLLKRNMEMHDQTRSLLESMADAVDLRDPYTGGHSRRVTAYAAEILRALNLSGPEAALITAAARVHDIGKIAIPDAILNKPGRLSDDERAVMESHPRRGADFLARYPDFHRGIAIVLHHHERVDGRGYPDGLRGDAIPFGARVIAVADSFDAMTSDRPYRAGMPAEEAARILNAGRGTQWDSAVVDAFVAWLDSGALARAAGDGQAAVKAA